VVFRLSNFATEAVCRAGGFSVIQFAQEHFMRSVRVILSLAAIALFANGAAQAAIITGVSTADPASVGTLDSSSFTLVDNGNNDVPSAGVSNEADLEITFNTLHVPFTLTFTRNATAPNNVVNEYLFTVVVNNGTPKVPINELIVDVNGTGVTFDEDDESFFDPAPTGGVATHDQPTNKLTFTSFSIAPGADGTFTFSLDLAALNATSFNIVFTANPEPASMALAGLASCGLGGLVVRRRRKTNAKV
jgi:hypothetical protein